MQVNAQLAPRMILALVIGVAAGWLANRAGVPLPWMLGPMVALALACVGGVPVHPPMPLRPIVIPIIGVMLGSGLSVEVLSKATNWWSTMVLLAPFLALSSAVSYVYCRRFGGLDRVTAYYCSMPGGLNDMIILGGAAGGDEKRIALAHGARIMVVVLFVVLFYGYVLGVAADRNHRPYTGISELGPGDAFWLMAAAVVGLPLGRLLRLPAGNMLGPMILSGAAHVAGLVQVPPPTILVICAQIVLGTVIGSRFVGVSSREIIRDVGLGAVSAGLMLVVALAFAFVVHATTGQSVAQAFLAYSPGGLTEMSLLALAMGQDIAYVSLTHVARIMLVIFGAPLAFRLFGRRD